jgi:hypothetical protein
MCNNVGQILQRRVRGHGKDAGHRLPVLAFQLQGQNGQIINIPFEQIDVSQVTDGYRLFSGRPPSVDLLFVSIL